MNWKIYKTEGPTTYYHWRGQTGTYMVILMHTNSGDAGGLYWQWSLWYTPTFKNTHLIVSDTDIESRYHAFNAIDQKVEEIEKLEYLENLT